MITVNKLLFFAVGENLTARLREFLREGRFKTIRDTLVDGGLPAEKVKDFFELKLKVVGDTPL